jgi:general secretion pathway protein L
MVDEFLHWWAAQLRSLMPQSFAGLQQRWRNRLIAELHGPPAAHELTLTLQRHGQTRVLGRFALDRTGIEAMRTALASKPHPATAELRLPPGMLLEQRTTLPLAAEWTIGRVLLHEIERITPFAAADLFWTWSAERRNDVLGRLQVCLSLVPKAAISEAISALQRAGAAVSVLDAASPAGAPRRLQLRDPTTGDKRRRGLALACGVCVALAAAAVAIPFVNQSLAVQRAADRMASLRPGMQEIDALRQRIAGAEAGSSVLSALRLRVGDTMGILATLTRVLPDDTYVKDLTLHGRVATFGGQSFAAAHLISALASDPTIHNPGFTAPITRSEISGNVESFSVRLEFGP